MRSGAPRETSLKITGDSIDIEQLEHLEHSFAWKRIRERIAETIEVSIHDLKRLRDMDRLAREQSRVETLEMVLKLPRQLIAEIRQKQKDPK